MVLDAQTGLGAPKHPLGAHQTITVVVKVPSSGVTGFHLTLSAINPAASGFLIAWPHGAPRPTASMVNFTAGRSVATAAFVKGNQSVIDLYNGAQGGVDVSAATITVSGFDTQWAYLLDVIAAGAVQIVADQQGRSTGCC